MLPSFKNIKNKIEKKSNIDRLDKTIIITLLAALAITVVFIFITKITYSSHGSVDDENVVGEYSHSNEFEMRTYGEDKTKNMENLETPANEPTPISCWGDSYFVAGNITIPSFPAYLSKYANRIVYNIAVPSDTLEMTAARQGGVPMYVSPCDIKRDKAAVEITLSNDYGTNLTPSLEKNGGLNPCKINGIEGVIYESGGKYYFTRSQSGDEEIIADTITPVVTRGMDLRREDISVFFVGDDEIFADTQKTVELYKKMVDYLLTDKYLIIGPVKGDKTVLDNVNKALEDEFGEKYFDLRTYLCTDAVEEYSLNVSEADKEQLKEGILTDGYYMADGYFGNDVNEISGKAVYDKLVSLNYFANNAE